MESGSVALWLSLHLVLLFAGMPLAAFLFPRLADRGASVALPIVLAIVFLVSYPVGQISLSASAIVALLVLGVFVVATLRRNVTIDADAYLEVALVFTVAFCFLVAVRAVDPAIQPAGGEKFLDFGLLKAILRAETLPPEDFWFAGESMNYYYGGHLIVAQLVRITRTTPGVAYNLGLAGFFATFVTAAYGLAGNVAARDGAFERRAALLGAFFVAVASNLFTPLRLLLRPLPDDLAESVARTIGVWSGRFADERQGALVTDQQPFSMWDATGVIDGAIHETPLFAFVNGDLHAHMMAPTFTLLGATALFAYWLTPAADRRRRLLLLFGVVPVIAGIQAVVNSWSFPTLAGLTFLAVAFDRESPDTLLPGTLRERIETAGPLRTEFAGVVVALCASLAVVATGLLWSLPFWLTNVAGRSLAILPDRSSLADLVVVHGGFLLPVGIYFGYLAWSRWNLSRPKLAAATVFVVLGVAVTATLDLAVLGVLGPFLLGGYLLGSRLAGESKERLPRVEDARLATLPGFELALLLGAVGLILLVEFVYVQEDAGAGRFNTVFKVYSQVWALFAVGTAIALGRLLQLSRTRLPTPRWPTVLRGFVAVLVLSLSLYGVLTVGSHFGEYADSDAEATLDGTAHVDRFHPDEAAAIDWLDDRPGTPTIVTAPGRSYQWTSAPSAFTGVPTILGWEHHEHGWGRSMDAIQERAADVSSIYGADPAYQRDLLERYDVSYVYVGPVERERYSDDISVGEVSGVSPVETFGEVTIYEVDRAALAAEGN